MDFENDDDLTRIIKQMAEKEGVTLTLDEEKALMDHSKHFLEQLSQDVFFPNTDSTSVPLPDASEGTSPDPQTSITCDEYEECGVQTNQFSLGYPMPDFYPIEELQPRLLRRIRMPSPPIPPSLLSWIGKPGVLWYMMRNMGFESNEKIRKAMSHKHAVRNIYWKAALAAMFRCYDAFFLLKHAAWRCTRKDLDSAFTLYTVGMNHILRKLLLEVNKETEREKIKPCVVLSNTPLTLRKFFRSKKRVCKIKPLWVHYLYRNRSPFKKPYRVMNTKLKQSITAIAFSNAKNRYPRKYIPAEVIAEHTHIVISDYEDGTFDWQYQFYNLLSDQDNLYLKEDVSRILKRAEMNKRSYSKGNDKKQYDLRDSPHVRDNDEDIMNKPNRRDITKARLDNFFRLFHGPLIRIILERYLDSGEVKDWIDEIDLPMLILNIERKDELEKKKKSNCNDPTSTPSNTIESEKKEFDETVHSVLTQGYTQTPSIIEAPCGIEKWIYGEDYCGYYSLPEVRSDSCKKEDAELFQEIHKQYLAILEEEQNNT